jgi:hypothetical protein
MRLNTNVQIAVDPDETASALLRSNLGMITSPIIRTTDDEGNRGLRPYAVDRNASTALSDLSETLTNIRFNVQPVPTGNRPT